MIALGPDEVRARRRPLAILAVAGLRLLSGFCVALPLASLVAESGIGARAEGDRALFEEGGYLLLEVLRLQGPNLSAALLGLLPVVALGLALTAACNLTLFVALNFEGRLQLQAWLAHAGRALPGFLLLSAATAALQAALFLAGSIATAGLPDMMARPVAATALEASVWLSIAALAGALGGLSDVAKASMVRHGSGASASIENAVRSAKSSPIACCFGWLPPAGALLLAVGAAAELTSALDVARPGGLRVALVFLVHQLVIVASVWLRAAWFARASRLSAR